MKVKKDRIGKVHSKPDCCKQVMFFVKPTASLKLRKKFINRFSQWILVHGTLLWPFRCNMHKKELGKNSECKTSKSGLCLMKHRCELSLLGLMKI